jgi:hypothetical protein
LIEKFLKTEEVWLSNGENKLFFDEDKEQWRVICRKNRTRNETTFHKNIKDALEKFKIK